MPKRNTTVWLIVKLAVTSLFPLLNGRPMLLRAGAGHAKTKSQQSPAWMWNCMLCWACLEIWYGEVREHQPKCFILCKIQLPWWTSCMKKGAADGAIHQSTSHRQQARWWVVSSEGLQQKSCTRTDQPHVWGRLGWAGGCSFPHKAL